MANLCDLLQQEHDASHIVSQKKQDPEMFKNKNVLKIDKIMKCHNICGVEMVEEKTK